MDGQRRPILGANFGSEQQNRMDPPKKHTFTAASVNAKEFVPRSYQQINNSHHVQPNPSLTSYQDPVTQIKQAIVALTSNPASFDTVIMPLTSSLSASVASEDVLLKVINEILNHAIMEANFRYTGARMCNHFCHNFTTVFPHGNFQQHLLKRCREEFLSLKDGSVDASAQHKLRGFTFLMGELLTNLKTSNSEKFIILTGPVLDLLLLVISNPTEENLRCVVQVYKLSNNKLDLSDPKVDTLFSEVKKVVLDDKTKPNMRAMLMSIVEQRAAIPIKSPEAATSPSPPTPDAASQADPNLVSVDEVYYDGSGQPVMMLPEDVYAEGDCDTGTYYTEDGYGAQFNGSEYYQDYQAQDYDAREGYQDQAQWSAGDQEYLFESQDSYEDYMDDEMAKDYDKFLRESNLL